MNEKLTPNNSENDKSNLIDNKIDYKILLNRLREIKKTIALLEKTIFK